MARQIVAYASLTHLIQISMGTDTLVLDEHTFKDLEIFESDSEETCLFHFCNLSRTKGGSEVLRKRMQHPWSSGDQIRATQSAISYIIESRSIFDELPSAYTTDRVALYTHEVLPVVIQKSTLEFALGAFSLWANNNRYYLDILRGVRITCSLIETLRRFVSQTGLSSASGELAPIIEEISTLLALPRLAQTFEGKTNLWNILRLDQVFRLHEKTALDRLLYLLHEIDALVAMADVTHKQKFILPHIEQGSLRVRVEGLVHPYLKDAVPNPVELNQKSRVLFLTGPNMAGKTTYLRAFALSLYLAHLGMGVPAQRFHFVPAQRLFTSFTLNDDLRSGVSYFKAEALRIKAVAQAVANGDSIVALMDEPFKGTNVKDAFEASRSILARLATKQDCLFMFSSHLIELSEEMDEETTNAGQINCRYFEAQENEGKLQFDYTLHHGVSSQRLGMRVLIEEGIFDLLDNLPEK